MIQRKKPWCFGKKYVPMLTTPCKKCSAKMTALCILASRRKR